MRRLEKDVSRDYLKLSEWQSKHWGLPLQSSCEPIAICFHQIDLDNLLLGIDDPIGRDTVGGINLGLGYSVSATCSWGQDLYNQIRNALNSFLGYDVLAGFSYEKKVRLQR